MPEKKIEYAGSRKRGGLTAYEGLARRTGRSLSEIVELASQDRLCELFDERGFVGKPLGTLEALNRVERRKQAPGAGKDPLLALLELRKRAVRWAAEETT